MDKSTILIFGVGELQRSLINRAARRASSLWALTPVKRPLPGTPVIFLK